MNWAVSTNGASAAIADSTGGQWRGRSPNGFGSGDGYPAATGGLSGGGAMAVNGGTKLHTFPDGTSATILFDELRTGWNENDIRGTWALGQCGASVSAGNGRNDTPTPNLSGSGWDDIQGCQDNPGIGMGCCGCNSWQVTAKSRHSGGVMTGFADGSVKFISNSVSQQTWFLLHSRDDGQVLGNDF